MRPLDDDLVGLGEPRGGREDRARVAHGHVVAEEGPDPGDRGGEVDGAEDEHPRLRGVRRHEDRHPLAAPLTVGSVVQGLVATGGEQTARVGGHRVVGSARAELPWTASACPSGRMTSRRPTQLGSSCCDDGRHRDGSSGLDVGGHRSELGERLLVDHLDEDVEDATAGQPDRERVLVADAVALEDRCAVGDAPARPARRPRPRRSRPTPSRPPRRRARPASRHPAARGADWKVATTVADADGSSAAPTTAAAVASTSRIGDHLQGPLERRPCCGRR